MDLTFTDSETAFRDELRAWFAANPPGEEPRGRTRTTPGGATSSAGSPPTAWPRCTGRRSTAAAARR